MACPGGRICLGVIGSRYAHAMGGTKRQLEEQSERGWTSSECRVCSSCVADYALREELQEYEVRGQGPCLACGQDLSAPFDILLDVFVDGIKFLYDDALNSVPYVSSEGGFVGAPVEDTWDLIDRFWDMFEDESSDKIIQELRLHIADITWVDRRDPDYGPEALLDAAWLTFSRVITHETRYVFWLGTGDREPNGHPWEIDPASALMRVGQLIDELGMFRQVPQGHRFYRARTFARGTEAPTTAKSLGTPPVHLSLQGNRMSPAGIPMFYAGEDPKVVLDEVSVRTEHRLASVGEYAATIPFKVVDLTNIPPVPSPFDRAKRDNTWKIQFLGSFVRRMSEPIRAGRDQVDYVPTQVMTEYLLRVHWGRDEVRGIQYPSAAHDAGVSLVIDVPAEDFLDDGDVRDTDRLQMELISSQVYSAKLDWNRQVDSA